MHLKVITPDKILLSEEVDEVTVNTTEGTISILPQHMPLVTSLVPGEMELKAKGKIKHFAIAGGFLEVGKDQVTLLADFAVSSEEIEVDKAMAAKKRAEEILNRSKETVSERDFAIAQADLRRAVSELHVAGRRRRERSARPQ